MGGKAGFAQTKGSVLLFEYFQIIVSKVHKETNKNDYQHCDLCMKMHKSKKRTQE